MDKKNHSWMIFYPDRIIPDSGLTGPNDTHIYIYREREGESMSLVLCHQNIPSYVIVILGVFLNAVSMTKKKTLTVNDFF